MRTVRRPVEVRPGPPVLEAAAQLCSVAVDGERRRVPVRYPVRRLVEPVDGTREEEYLRAVLRYGRVAVVGKRLSRLAGNDLGLGLERARRRDGKNQLRFARLEIHRPEAVILRPWDILARILSRTGVAVVWPEQRKPCVVDGNRPCAILGYGGNRHRQHILVLCAPVHHDGAELSAPHIVEDDFVVTHPVRHSRFLEVPAGGRRHRDKTVAVHQVNHAKRTPLVSFRKPSVHISFQDEHITPVGTP